MTRVKLEKPLAVTVEKAGLLLGISRNLAYQMARAGKIPTVKLGKRRLLVPIDKLKEMLSMEGASDEQQGID